MDVGRAITSFSWQLFVSYNFGPNTDFQSGQVKGRTGPRPPATLGLQDHCAAQFPAPLRRITRVRASFVAKPYNLTKQALGAV